MASDGSRGSGRSAADARALPAQAASAVWALLNAVAMPFAVWCIAAAVREGASAGNNIAAAVREGASAGNNIAAAGNNIAAAVREGASAGNNIAAAVNEGASAGNNIAAAVRDVASAVDVISCVRVRRRRAPPAAQC